MQVDIYKLSVNICSQKRQYLTIPILQVDFNLGTLVFAFNRLPDGNFRITHSLGFIEIDICVIDMYIGVLQNVNFLYNLMSEKLV